MFSNHLPYILRKDRHSYIRRSGSPFVQSIFNCSISGICQTVGPFINYGLTVASGADDGYFRVNGSLLNSTSTAIEIGTDSSPTDFTGFIRFTNIQLPQSTVINNVNLNLGGIVNPADPKSIKLYGIASGNVLPINSFSRVNDPTTSSFKQLTELDFPSIPFTLNVTNIVQEIVNRGDWNSGNALAFYFKPDSDGNQNVKNICSFEGSGTLGVGPSLTINYQETSPQLNLYMAEFAQTQGICQITSAQNLILGNSCAIQGICQTSSSLNFIMNNSCQMMGICTVDGRFAGLVPFNCSLLGTCLTSPFLNLFEIFNSSIEGICQINPAFGLIFPFNSSLSGICQTNQTVNLLVGLSSTLEGIAQVTSDLETVASGFISNIEGVCVTHCDLGLMNGLGLNLNGVCRIVAELSGITQSGTYDKIPFSLHVNRFGEFSLHVNRFGEFSLHVNRFGEFSIKVGQKPQFNTTIALTKLFNIER